VIHGDDDVDRKKVDSAAEFVADLNPDVDVRRHEMRVAPDNIEDLIDGYDYIVDGTDNFETRYLVNDARTLAGIPFSHGSIFRFEGQVTTLGSPSSPCSPASTPQISASPPSYARYTMSSYAALARVIIPDDGPTPG
jgi:adenylyltransferase/sulfurtransferase